MPGFDGRGPLGQGPLTGRGLGYCVVKLDPNDEKNQDNKGKGVSEMPRGDGTGPMGQGPMTGRAAGFCAGYNVPGYVNPTFGGGNRGRGATFGRGGGRGRRNWYYATGLPGWQRAAQGMPAFGGSYLNATELTPKQQADILKSQADLLQKQLEDIQSRIEVLEKSQAEKSE